MSMLSEETLADVSVEVPRPDVTGSKFIFTVADLIAPTIKATNPLWKLGGVIIEDSLCLKYCNNYVRRCEITELRQQMESEEAGNFAPGERKHMPRSYNINTRGANGQVAVRTIGADTDERGRPANRRYIPFYPSNEIQTITAKNNGVVAMPVKNAQERHLAQQFLFPNWDAITQGMAQFPTELSKLRAYLVKRREEALRIMGGEPTVFLQVAEAAIQSCDLYLGWVKEFISTYNAQWEEARTKGWAWSFPARAEMMFEQSGLQRRDNLVQAQADKMDALTDVMTKQVEMQNQILAMQLAQGGGPLTPQPAVVPKAAPVEETAITFDTPEPEAEIATCGAITAKGTQCTRPAEDDGYCAAPSHKAQAEEADDE